MKRIKLEDEKNVYYLVGKRIRKIGEKREYLIGKLEIKATETKENKIEIYDNNDDEVIKCFSSDIYSRLLKFEVME